MKRIIVLLAFVAIAGLAQANLLSNGDFELGAPGNLGSNSPTDWGAWGWNGWLNRDSPPSIDTQSVKMWWDDTGIWQSYAGTAGETYEYSVQVQDWSGNTNEITWDAVLAACFYTDTGGFLLRQEFVLDTATVADDVWHTLSGTATAPDETYWVQMQLYLTGWEDGIDGSIYFDNASLTLVPEPMTMVLMGLGGIFLRRRR